MATTRDAYALHSKHMQVVHVDSTPPQIAHTTYVYVFLKRGVSTHSIRVYAFALIYVKRNYSNMRAEDKKNKQTHV